MTIKALATKIYAVHHQTLMLEARRLDIEEAVAGAILMVESAGKGFGSDNRMIVRFEPKTFFKRTNKYVVDFHLGQASEYAALEKAIAINEGMAYESISMGIAQIMGFNHIIIGYPSAKQMFDALSANIENQLAGLFSFIAKSAALVKAAREKDWAEFACHYNGSGYKKNNYDTKLENCYNAYLQIIQI